MTEQEFLGWVASTISAVLIGSVVGGAIAVFLVGAVIWWLFRDDARRRR